MTGFADVPFSQIKGDATTNQSLVDNFAKLESTTQTVEAAAFSIYDSLNAQHYDLTSDGNTLYYSGNLVLDQTTGALNDDQSQVVGMAQLDLFDVTADAYAGLTVDNGQLLLAGNPVGGDPITTGSTDNAILRADGTGGATLQNSAIVIDDEIVPFACTGVASTDVVTAVGHNFTANQGVRFPTLTGGGNLNTTTIYFVRDISGNTFKVSTTAGGSARDITTDMTAGTVVAVQENVTIRNNSTATNSPIVLTPKGNGGFVLGPKPDGTSTGGNRRGQYAVDLQIYRTDANDPASVASGDFSFLTGSNSRTSGTRSSALGIYNSTVSGFNASAVGCFDSNLNSSFALGLGGICAPNGKFGVVCFGQQTYASQVILGQLTQVTTTNSSVELSLWGTASLERFAIPSGRINHFLISITGVRSDGSASAHYLRQYAIKNVAGTTSEVFAPVTIGTDTASGTSISITANDTNDALKIECTGVSSQTWRWHAVVWCSELAYGT